jgi:hypothetical protein
MRLLLLSLGLALAAIALMAMFERRNRSSPTEQKHDARSRAQKVDVKPLPEGEWLGAPSGEERDLIFGAILRHVCHTNPIPRRVRHIHKIYFVRFGEAHDPSPEFLARLRSLPCRVQPISTGRGTPSNFYDEATGSTGEAFYLRSISKLSTDEAEVETEKPQSGSPFSGLRSRIVYRVIRKNGEWVVTGGELKELL